MSIKFKTAKTVASISRNVLQNILKRDGGFYPGKLAMKIDPDILSDLSEFYDKGTILVTGTNGKTSVTGLLADCLKYQGLNCAWNKTGANLSSGVVASMLEHELAVKNNVGVFEVDELWVAKVLPQLKSDILLLLNLFPDQADRFGSIKNIQNSLIDALNMSPETTLVYNADDPNCQYIADECSNHCIAFGIGEPITDNDDYIDWECPNCGQVLKYSRRQYAQLGKYRCSNCGFNRAGLNFATKNIKLTNDSLEFTIKDQVYSTNKAAEYVCYNLSGFIVCAKTYGCSYESITKAISTQRKDNGRMQVFDYGNKKIMINLAKNPVGFNQNINYISNQLDQFSQSDKIVKSSVAFFVNAREGDGRSTEWLADVKFEKLQKYTNLSIYHGGEAYEALIKELLEQKIVSHRVEDVADLLSETKSSEYVYIVANYTAMFPLRDQLIKICK